MNADRLRLAQASYLTGQASMWLIAELASRRSLTFSDEAKTRMLNALRPVIEPEIVRVLEQEALVAR